MSRSSARTVQLGCMAAAVYGESILFDIMKLCHKIVCYGYGSGCSPRLNLEVCAAIGWLPKEFCNNEAFGNGKNIFRKVFN